MAETYTIANFDPSVIPTGFNSEARKTMRGAIAAGWKLVVTNRGHCTMVAPPPNEHITINVSQRKSDGPVRQIREKITRYGNPLLMEGVDSGKEIAKRIEQTERLVEQTRERPAPKPKASVTTEDITKGTPFNDGEFFDDEPKVKYEAPTEQDRAARTIVRSGPMVARRGRRRGYESQVAIEREWSDGTIEYVCNVPDCTSGPDGGPYVTENRLAMGPHRKVHVNLGQVEKIEDPRALTIEVPDHEPAYTKEYAPRDERLRSLASVLLEKIISLGPDLTDHEKAEALAQAALEWGHTRTDGGLGRGEREPLSDAELLARIRGMLDNGMYARQADEIATQRAAREAAEARAEAAVAEAQKVKDDINGLLDLLAEYRQEAKA